MTKNSESSKKNSKIKANIATAIIIIASLFIAFQSGMFGQSDITVNVDDVNTNIYEAKCLSLKDNLDEQAMALCESQALNTYSLEGNIRFYLQSIILSIAVVLFASGIAFRLYCDK